MRTRKEGFSCRVVKRLRVDNRTSWDTGDLKRLFGRCIREAGMESARTVRVIYSKSGQVTGYAYIGRRWLQMALPNIRVFCREDGRRGETRLLELSGEDVKEVAQVFLHELDHNRGIRHKEMKKHYKIPVPFVEGMVIHRKKEKEKPRKDIVGERSRKATQMVRIYQGKVKRYSNLLKKWQGKVAYYKKKEAKKDEND